MMRTNGCSKAMFGGLLWGDKPLRYVFVDEAGTSENEPVTVVVGIIANADEHVMSAEAAVAEALGAVPEQYKKDFVFHAMQVWGDKKYQDGWSVTDRLALLKTIMMIPRKIGMAISIGVQWRSGDAGPFFDVGLMPCQVDHLMAFYACMALADRNIRDHAAPREVATVVAEDCAEMRKFLKRVPVALRESPWNLEQEYLRATERDVKRGYISQRGDFRVTRIRNSVHFVEKADDPLVQVADAVAYGLRRYFAKERFGEDYARSIVGDIKALAEFAPPGGATCFWPRHQIDPANRVYD